MQNWNQWQLPAAPITAPMPQPPIGYAAPGADPMATMQAYMQYYNQPAPSGYTAEQWSAAQQQNWSQWQTWQQQYQQWQAQYGEKYQETMKQMSSQSLPSVAQMPQVAVGQPPPLPKEDTNARPPLPPEGSAYGFAGIPPPHQNNLPLFPSSKQTGNPPLPPSQPPLPNDNSNISSSDNNLNGKRGSSSNVETGSAKKLKSDDEELTAAEKTFDTQFKQWEEQFDKWKQQNANHPAKTQYKEDEAKWTSWREKLIVKREQMRRKREQQKQAAAKAEAEKNKSMAGDDKILNILSSTENQSLINNLLGIGKTLGLTGKQDIPGPPMGPQPALSAQLNSGETAMAMGAPTMTPNMNQAAWAAQQWAAQYNAGMNMTNYTAGYQQAQSILPPVNNAQQAPMPLMNFNQPPGNFNQPPTNFNQPPGNFSQPSTNFNQQQTSFNQQPTNFNQQQTNFNQQPPNFNQPPTNFNQPPGNFQQPPPLMPPAGAQHFSNAPPNLSAGGPNLSLPPPRFGGSNVQQQSNTGQRTGQGNTQDPNSRSFRNDGDTRQGPPPSRDSVGGNDRLGFDGKRFSGPPPNDRTGTNSSGQFGSNENFGRDGSNKDFGSGNQSFGSGSENIRRDGSGRDFSPIGRGGNDFRSNDRLGNNDSNDRFQGAGFDRDQDGGDRFGRDNDRQEHGDNRFDSDRDSFDRDRFNSSSERFGSGIDRFSSGNDRFTSDNDRPGSGNDQSRQGGNRFGSSNDRFGSGNDQFGTSSGDRFGTSNDRQGSSGDRISQSNDRFARQPQDRFESRDGNRDSFGSNSRGFGRSNQFDPPDAMSPELKKLMEKRKAAMDVFKPSNFGSFLSTDKTISTGTSLSESFRKITGDSPFSSRSFGDFVNKDSFGGRGSAAGSSGSRDSRPGDDGRSPDFKSRGAGDFKSGGPGDFRPRGDFPGPRGGDSSLRGPDAPAGPRRLLGDFPSRMGNEFGPPDNRMRNEFEPSSRNEQGPQQRDNRGSDNRALNSDNFGPDNRAPNSDNFGPDNRAPNSDNCRPDNRALGSDNCRPDNRAPNSDNFGPDNRAPNSDNCRPDNRALSLDNCRPDNRALNSENSERMQRPHSMEERKEAEDNFESRPPADSNDSPSRQIVPPLPMPPWMSANFADDDIIDKPVSELADKDPSVDSSKDKSEPPDLEKSRDMPEEISKKSDSLPFMGENDPKPEDLNMEPPPNLPNLGPVIKGPDTPFEQRGNMGGPFGSPSGGFNLRPPFDAPFGPRGMQMGATGPMPFGSRGPNDSRFPPFGQRGMGGLPENMGPPFAGPNTSNIRPFGPRGPQDDRFNARGPPIGAFGPGGPPDFSPRGLPDFGPRGPSDFGPRGPFDFGPRGPSDFGPRGPSDFGPRGPSDFGPRGPSDFGPRGPSDFGPRGPSDSGPRGPPDFGPRGPSDSGPRGPSDFGPRGPPDFGPRGPGDFRPRDSNDGQFGPRGSNDRPFGPRGPLTDRPFEPRDQNDAVFGARPSFGSNAFPPRGNLDAPRSSSIPSLMAFKLDGPPPLAEKSDDTPPEENEDFEGNNLPPAFRGGDQDQRAFGGDALDDGEPMESEPGPQGPNRPGWRQPFTRNKFGDSDQRSGTADLPGAPPTGCPAGIDQEISGVGDRDGSRRSFGSEERMMDKGGPVEKLFDESAGGFGDNNRPGATSCATRRPDKHQGARGGGPQKEFCIEKQYNYNHGTGVPDEISTEHTPANVIDYAHAPRVIVHDYVTPAQCFDYGHGNLKPIVPEHVMYPKKDFKHWVENEQNLKDYTDRMKVYDSDLRALHRRPPDRGTIATGQQTREPSWIQEERRSFERDRRNALHRNERNRRDRESDDYRDRGRESRENRERGRIERDREWERNSNKHREDRSQQRRSNSKDRTRERPEKIRKELNRENSKDDERSKGNVSGQESSAKKPVDSTSQENSEQETKHVEPDVSPKPIESPKTTEMPKSVEPPKTMELPKTPNFTMVDDLLGTPGRQNRPPKIVIILRGPPGSGKSFVAKLIKDKEVEQGGSAPRILSIDDYFLTEKEVETKDDNGKKVTTKEMVYEYEEAMEQSYITSLIKAFKKNITDGFFNFIILDSINEKISDYEEMWSFAKTKGFRVYVCEMEMDTQICLKRNIHKRSEDEINRIVDYFEPTPGYHQKLDVTSLLQEEAIEEVQMEDTQDVQASEAPVNDDSQDSQEDPHDAGTVSKWERMEAEDKLDRLDGLAKKKHETTPHTMEDFLQVPDYYNMEDTSGKKRVRWADLEERKEQEKMRAVGFVVGQTNWDRMMDPTKGGSALTRTKYI